MAFIELEQVRKVLDFFKDLIFDEPTHTYMVHGQPFRSVSKTIETVAIKTDFVPIAEAIAKRDGGTAEQILQGWADHNKAAIDRGHKTHSFAEGNLANPTTGLERAVVKFWQELDRGRYKVVGKEVRMYHKNHIYAGTSDLVLYDTQLGEYIIADYKTNADLFKNFKGQLLKAPFSELLDNPYNKYQIQLSLYQILLEQVCNPISERWVIWLTEEGNYSLLKTYDLTNRVREWLKTAFNHDNKRSLGFYEIRA